MGSHDLDVVGAAPRHVEDLAIAHRRGPSLDSAQLGGKGASLARMKAMDMPVPPGFVVTTRAFDWFLASNGISLHQRTTQDEAADAREQILGAIWPRGLAAEVLAAFDQLASATVAVRSSAAMEDGHGASWAGQFETSLWTPRDTLLARVQQCWASLMSPAAIAYGAHVGLHERTMAVVVQAMVNADVSGTLFSIEPVRNDTRTVVIEAVSGCGEQLAQGAVRPHRYLMDKATRGIGAWHPRHHGGGTHTDTEADTGADTEETSGGGSMMPSLLDTDALDALTAYAVHLEATHGTPVEVEWCLRHGELFLLQCRPVTTMSVPTVPGAYWFSWGEACTVLTAEAWTRIHRERRGLASGADDALVYSLDGQLSVHLHDKELARASIAGAAEIASPDFLVRFLEQSAASRAALTTLREEIASHALDSLPPAHLAALLSQYVTLQAELGAWSNFSQPEYMEPARARLRAMVATEDDFIAITSPTDLTIIQSEELDALELSFTDIDDASLRHHAERHPWLLSFSFDDARVVDVICGRIDALRAESVEARCTRMRGLLGHADAQRRSIDAAMERLDGGPELERLARIFREISVDRLRIKWHESGAEYLFRHLFQAISRRIGVPIEDLHRAYREQDIIAALMHGTRLPDTSVIERRHAYLIRLLGDQVEFLQGERAVQEFERFVPPPVREGVSTLTGTPATTGRARGRVRLVRDAGVDQLLRDMATFPPGSVLVTGMTQPTMMSLARAACAVVTDEGGITSHAAVIARELGIPCIVGTGCGTRVLNDGDLVEVDATHGRITLLEEEAP